MNKKIQLMLLIIAVFLFFNISYSVAAGVSITSSTTTLSPGSNAVISLTITNSETYTLSDVSVAFVELSDGFSGDVCSSCSTYVGGVCTKYSDSCFVRINDLLSAQSLSIDYPITVSSDITEGSYIAKFVVKYTVNKGSATEKTYDIIKTVPLTISSGEHPTLVLKDIEIPELLKPNENFVLKFNISNYKAYDAKDVKIILEGSDIGDSILLVNTTNEITVPFIKGKDSQEISIKLKTSPEIDSGAHNFNIKLNYSDSKKNYYSTTYTISTLVGGESDFVISLQDITPEIVEKNKIVEITIGIINDGLLDARSVRIALLKNEDFETGQITEEVIGDLDSGDYTSVDFEIMPKKDDIITLPIRIYYLDSIGKNRQKNYNLTLKVGVTEFYTIKSEIEKKENNTLLYITIGAIILIIIYFWRKKRNKK